MWKRKKKIKNYSVRFLRDIIKAKANHDSQKQFSEMTPDEFANWLSYFCRVKAETKDDIRNALRKIGSPHADTTVIDGDTIEGRFSCCVLTYGPNGGEVAL